MKNYSSRNITCTPNPFKRKSIAVNDGIVDKARDIKSPSDKKLCEVARFLIVFNLLNNYTRVTFLRFEFSCYDDTLIKLNFLFF